MKVSGFALTLGGMVKDWISGKATIVGDASSTSRCPATSSCKQPTADQCVRSNSGYFVGVKPSSVAVVPSGAVPRFYSATTAGTRMQLHA